VVEYTTCRIDVMKACGKKKPEIQTVVATPLSTQS
jgi:hypothetical protein